MIEVDRRRKLTNNQVRALRELRATGQFTQSALAKMFGISQTQVSLIVRGKSR